MTKALRRQLDGDARWLRRRLAETVPAPEAGGENADRAVHHVIRELAHDTRERYLRELRATDAALTRLDAGTFGTCEGCGDPISAARLRVLPTATHCLACQVIREREDPQARRNGRPIEEEEDE